jgi:glucosamine-6-phosphate deaminase
MNAEKPETMNRFFLANHDRGKEIIQLNALSLDELTNRAEERLTIVDDLEQLHQRFAFEIASAISTNNAADKSTALILPYGPSDQFPILREILNRERISLRHTTLFFMDEYADTTGKALSASHPLSFKGAIQWLWESLDPGLGLNPSNIIFPDEENVDKLTSMIHDVGGIDVCFGGVGIHGHLAFNEPELGVRESGPRLVHLNEYTVTMNAIRSQVGGDLENFPRQAWTLGMRQCLSARRVQLYCRNDIPGLQWANTVLRLSLLGRSGDDYPVTWVREHPDWEIFTDRATAAPPQNRL